MTNVKLGIVGLPNVGKSTLFNVLTKLGIEAKNFPFCTIEPNEGIVEVKDPRLEVLAKITHSQEIHYATITFVDIAGLVAGASKGEGLGNQFLSHIRQMDALIMMVRCFTGEDIIHVSGKVNPLDDIQVIETELLLADLQVVENSLAKLQKQAKAQKQVQKNVAVLEQVQHALEKGQTVQEISFSEEEQQMLSPYTFLTQKKMLFVTNVAEKDLPSMENDLVKQVAHVAKQKKSSSLAICAKFEEELSLLEPEDQKAFLLEAGLQESAINRLTRVSFSFLGLITFFTSGEKETKAWTITKGTSAKEAAAKIHTDISKGFIRAEVISYEDYVQYEGRAGAKAAGKARSEGKEYVVQDGDVILFFHN